MGEDTCSLTSWVQSFHKTEGGNWWLQVFLWLHSALPLSLSALNPPANWMSCLPKKEMMSRWGDHRQGRLETGPWWGKGLEPCWFCPPVWCCPALSTQAGSRLATERWKPSPYLHPHRCFPLHGHPPFPLGHQPLQLGNAVEAWFWIWNSCSRSMLITVWSCVFSFPRSRFFPGKQMGSPLCTQIKGRLWGILFLY